MVMLNQSNMFEVRGDQSSPVRKAPTSQGDVIPREEKKYQQHVGMPIFTGRTNSKGAGVHAMHQCGVTSSMWRHSSWLDVISKGVHAMHQRGR
jgi:hypothetical protein